MDKQKAQQEKARGNDAFARRDWAQAIGHYAAAQIADPTEPAIPLNRAMAYLKLEKFQDAERDCTTALRLAPDSVKATFRRAKARVGVGKLAEAVADFEQVLRLDPANKDAKAELPSARAALEQCQPRRTALLDLSFPSKTARAVQDPTGDEDDDRLSNEGSTAASSVEAARKFLQRIGMEDPADSSSGSDRAQTSKTAPAAAAPVGKIPERLPGETGGFLHEVSSKRVTATPAQASTASAAETARPSPPLITPLSMEATESGRATPPSTVAAASKTASALSFGLGPSASSGPPQPQRPLAAKAVATRKLNAVEFQRTWKEQSRLTKTPDAGAGGGNKEQRIAQQQLRFLQSLDPASLPQLMDSLLEPELLSSLLLSLATSIRTAASLDASFDANKRPIEIPSSSQPLLEVVRGLVKQLPRCKRFAMIVAMLDAEEKRAASTLIHALEDNDALGPGCVFSTLASCFIYLGEFLQEVCLAVGEISAVLVRALFGLVVVLCDLFAAVSCCWRVPWSERPDRRNSTYDTQVFADVGDKKVLSGAFTKKGREQKRQMKEARKKERELRAEDLAAKKEEATEKLKSEKAAANLKAKEDKAAAKAEKEAAKAEAATAKA